MKNSKTKVINKTSLWQWCKRRLMDVALLLPPVALWMTLLSVLFGWQIAAAATTAVWLAGFLPNWLGSGAYMLFFGPMAWIAGQEYFIYKTNHMARCCNRAYDVIPANVRMPNTYLAMLLPACYASYRQSGATEPLVGYVKALAKVKDQQVLAKVTNHMINGYGTKRAGLKMRDIADIAVPRDDADQTAFITDRVLKVVQAQHIPLAVLQQRLLDEEMIGSQEDFATFLSKLVFVDSLPRKTYREAIQEALPSSSRYWFDDKTQASDTLQAWIFRMDLKVDKIQRLMRVFEAVCAHDLNCGDVDPHFKAIMDTKYFDDFMTLITDGKVGIAEAIKPRFLQMQVLYQSICKRQHLSSAVSWQGCSLAELETMKLFLHDTRVLQDFDYDKSEWVKLEKDKQCLFFFQGVCKHHKCSSEGLSDFVDEFFQNDWQVYMSTSICQQMRSMNDWGLVREAYRNLSRLKLDVNHSVVRCFQAGENGWNLESVGDLIKKYNDLKAQKIQCFPDVAAGQTLREYLNDEMAWDRLVFESLAHGNDNAFGVPPDGMGSRDLEYRDLFVKCTKQYPCFKYNHSDDYKRVLGRLQQALVDKVQKFLEKHNCCDNYQALLCVTNKPVFRKFFHELAQVLMALSIAKGELHEEMSQGELDEKTREWKVVLVNMFCMTGQKSYDLIKKTPIRDSWKAFSALITFTAIPKNQFIIPAKLGEIIITCRAYQAEQESSLEKCYRLSVFMLNYRDLDKYPELDPVGFFRMYAFFFYLIDQVHEEQTAANQLDIVLKSIGLADTLETIYESEPVVETVSSGREMEVFFPRCQASRNEIFDKVSTFVTEIPALEQKLTASTMIEQVTHRVAERACQLFLQPLYNDDDQNKELASKLAEFLLLVFQSSRNKVIEDFNFGNVFNALCLQHANESIPLIIKEELQSAREQLQQQSGKPRELESFDIYANWAAEYPTELLDGCKPEWLLASLRDWLTPQLAKFIDTNRDLMNKFDFFRGSYQDVYKRLGLSGNEHRDLYRNRVLLAVYIVPSTNSHQYFGLDKANRAREDELFKLLCERLKSHCSNNLSTVPTPSPLGLTPKAV